MSELILKRYTPEFYSKWDEFVLNKSMNGTFLQTRRFIEYHPEGRFYDHSLVFLKGNDIVACILACEIGDDEQHSLFSHKGTTFGGIIISKSVYNTTNVAIIMDLLDAYLKDNKFDSVFLKQTPRIFTREDTDLIDYYLYQRGYKEFSELNFYMHLDRYKENLIGQFSSGKRRDYRYSLKNNLDFRKLKTKGEITEYYNVLQMNLKKLNLPSVHSLNDLYDLKFNRFTSEIEFYGVYFNGVIIAGSVLFLFDKERIIHTQYLSSDESYLSLYPMDFLIENLIELAINKGAELFTFGICTEDRGRYLNLGLSRFKEGFGTEYAINKSFEKNFS